jgi:pimeloyl-ACP methyl ester carboxylesterase
LPHTRSNGVNLYYELNGEQGDPLVLIHGSWGDHHNWDAVIPGLSRSFRALVYDRRGHSRSEKVTTQGSFDEDAEDTAALISDLGFSRAHIIGNSGGATIALKLASTHPSIFKSLIIHEPPLLDLLPDDATIGPMLKEGKRRAEEASEMLEMGDIVGGTRLFVETIAFGPGQWDKLPQKLKETFISNADTFLDEIKDPTGLVVDLNALAKFDKPALLSYGGKSATFFKPIVEKLATVIPNSKLESYPNDGHTPHISNPEEFVKRVKDFVSTGK